MINTSKHTMHTYLSRMRLSALECADRTLRESLLRRIAEHRANLILADDSIDTEAQCSRIVAWAQQVSLRLYGRVGAWVGNSLINSIDLAIEDASADPHALRRLTAMRVAAEDGTIEEQAATQAELIDMRTLNPAFWRNPREWAPEVVL